MSTPPNLLPGTLAGVETEYAVTAFSGGQRLPAPYVSEALVRLAAQSYPSLPSGQDDGVHLTNAGKLYRERGADTGSASDLYGLPEFATSECSDPLELVSQVEAGNLLMEELCARLPDFDPAFQRATVYRHGVDHVNRTSWATHLSVMTTSSIETLADQLSPFLASKVLIGGAGGFSLQDQQFSVAPRCATIVSVTSGTTTHHRGLLDTRQLSHCPSGLGRRQHLIGFECLSSELARFVEAGSTLLVMRLCDAGLEPAKGVRLANPIEALQAFCRDPYCRVKQTTTTRRRKVTAIEIQEHYLEAVRSAMSAGIPFPSWAGDCCEKWEELLTDLKRGAPESLADRLDWATKWVLFQESGASIERQLEIDIRFGQLNPDGIFRQLDEAGLLAHRILPPERIARALHTPPQDTRAKARGDAVAELHASGEGGHAYWDRVVSSKGRSMDLSNPFVATGTWKERSTASSVS